MKSRHLKIKQEIIILLFFFLKVYLFSQDGFENYPLIKALKFSDPVFKQYTEDVSNARIAFRQGKNDEALPIKFYKYKVEKGWQIIQIASRCSMSYDGIVSLNQIQSPKDTLEGTYILLPTMPGLYLPENPGNPIEKLLSAAYEKEIVRTIEIYILKHGEKRKMYCLPDAFFDGTTRRYFLSPLYRFPLDSGILTSGFGKRPSPFTGKPSYHPGIDLAAPQGSPVYACAPGKVTSVAFSRVYGNHIIIAHNDGQVSLYGHLSETLVVLNDVVKAGTIIGKVGSTGMSTGPHLHFEIRKKGVPTDPEVYIKNVK